MPKNKQKGVKSDGSNIQSSSSSCDDDDLVCTYLELNLKPLPSKKSTSLSAKDEFNLIDDKCAIIHLSDAYKMDVRDGESALIIRTISPSSLTIHTAVGDINEDDSNYNCIASICNIQICQSPPTSTGTPSSRMKSSQMSAKCGDVLLSTSLYDYITSTRNNDDSMHTKTDIPPSTPQASTILPTTTHNTQYTSPSKSNFSFSKGGGGDSLISPSPSNKFISPSGSSKFAFTKKGGGGGDVLHSSSHTKQSTSKNSSPLGKVMVIPLLNLSSQQLNRTCTDAQTIRICSVSDIGQQYLTSCSKIIQTLILSKYHGKYIMQAESAVSDRDKQQLETISISFRGQIEYFHVMTVIQSPSSSQGDDENQLSTVLDQLDISCAGESKVATSLATLLLRSSQGKGKYTSEIAYRITAQTKIELVSSLDERLQTTESIEQAEGGNKQQATVVCAGLDSTLAKIKDALLPPLLHPNFFPADGPLRPPKGALLYGPAGVGKSLMAAQIANDLGCSPDHAEIHVRLVQCADILSSTSIVGEAEKILTDVFEEAGKKATSTGGSLVIMDDVHLICPRRGGMGGSGGLGVDQLAGTLLALLDGIGSSNNNKPSISGGGLVVLAITTDPSSLDPALRRPGRLDVEVEVPVPDDTARANIIRFHLLQLMTTQQLDKLDIKALARLAKGFTGADCKLAIKEAVRSAISRTHIPEESKDEQFSIEYVDLEHAIRITKPSAIKSVAVEIPKVPWSAIGGMDDVKALLRESIELPLTHPHLFEMMQVPPPKGILLYGPPGCSKTLMARAIATEGNMNFLAVKGPELLSKWLGESERALASLFRRARLASPAVIFFDEVDAIASKRGGSGGGGSGDRLLSQLLTELDGVTSGGSGALLDGGKSGRVVVVGATNRPDVLDPALTRPGRMDRMIYVGLPDEQGRNGIFRIGLSGKDCHDDVDVSALWVLRISLCYLFISLLSPFIYLIPDICPGI